MKNVGIPKTKNNGPSFVHVFYPVYPHGSCGNCCFYKLAVLCRGSSGDSNGFVYYNIISFWTMCRAKGFWAKRGSTAGLQ